MVLAVIITNTTNQIPPRVSPWRALFPLFFVKEQYLEMAISHSLAVSLDKPSNREAFKRGEYPHAAWEQDTKANLKAPADNLIHSFGKSFLITGMFFVTAIGFAMLLDRVSIDRPLDIGKSLSLTGAFLAGWATLFELGGYMETYSREQLHELLHPLLFRVIFLPGLAIAAIGQIW
jgi:hypothetical protein